MYVIWRPWINYLSYLKNEDKVSLLECLLYLENANKDSTIPGGRGHNIYFMRIAWIKYLRCLGIVDEIYTFSAERWKRIYVI